MRIMTEREAWERMKEVITQAAEQMAGTFARLKERQRERYHEALCEPEEDVFI